MQYNKQTAIVANPILKGLGRVTRPPVFLHPTATASHITQLTRSTKHCKPVNV